VAAADLRVAHNVAFDDRIMRIAMLRTGLGREAIEAMEGRPRHCTCVAATKVLNLPPTEKMVKAGFNRAKQANLTECAQHFFGEKLDGAHDAMIDARACARVYWHLQGLASAGAAA
jgi:DNA polymerase-3 subunit epsilon